MAPTTEVQLEDFNLKPNSTYFVELEAHNSLGKSKASYVQVTVTGKYKNLTATPERHSKK